MGTVGGRMEPSMTLGADFVKKRNRTRRLLALGGVILLASTFWWQWYSRDALSHHEARVIAGDFPAIRIETVKAQVDEFGRVAVNGYLTDPPLAVGSLRLTPQGTYSAILVAHDGNPAHRSKTELVIGARDAHGQWFPSSASSIAERLPVKNN